MGHMRQSETAVAVLHSDVLPFYRNLDLPVGAALTDNVLGREAAAENGQQVSLRRS